MDFRPNLKSTVNIGTKVTFLVLATDDVAVQAGSLTLTVGTTNLTLDSKGQAVMTMTSVGSFAVTASAKDAAGNTGTSAPATLTVTNLAGTPPTISLTAPLPGPNDNGNIKITAPTAITGSVSDDHTNGVSYTVTVIPADGSPSFQIGSGSITNASTLAFPSSLTFDPTMLADGDYTLEIKAKIDLSGQRRPTIASGNLEGLRCHVAETFYDAA